MPGYSATPLVKKLGLKDDWRVCVIGCPVGYRQLVPDVPASVVFAAEDEHDFDLIHLFVNERQVLREKLPVLIKKIRPDGMIWVSWPKKAAKMATDITEDVIREIALPLGLVDTKVCAVSEVWSGLRLVIRKEKRTSPI